MQREMQECEIVKHYLGGAIIEKISFGFSLSKVKKESIAMAKVVQLPVRLAFATTAHKIQGQTVKKNKESYC